MKRNAGFTLLEVMVAIAILALALSAIFSSEAGAARMAHRARKTGLAALLARCKMGEIEEQVMIEGFPAIFDSGSDNCCEEGEIEGFSCDWEIHPVVLPDTMFELDEEGLSEAFANETQGQTEGQAEGEGKDAVDPNDPFGGSSTEDLLSGGGDLGGLASIAMQYAYPVLKPSFEGQIRRATVVVRWNEGNVEHTIDVTQYLVSQEPVELLQGIGEEQAPETGAEGAEP